MNRLQRRAIQKTEAWNRYYNYTLDQVAEPTLSKSTNDGMVSTISFNHHENGKVAVATFCLSPRGKMYGAAFQVMKEHKDAQSYAISIGPE